MRGSGLEKLLVDELRDLYNAEQQMLKALPKMAKAAGSADLRTAFEEHRDQTQGQVERLDRAFELLDVPARGKKCVAMEGLIEEGKELIEEGPPTSVLDAGLIGAAQKVEHYEIAGYGTARRHAEVLGLDDVAGLLEETLEEEKQTDEKLTQLAEEINVEAEGVGAGSGSAGGRGTRERVSARR